MSTSSLVRLLYWIWACEPNPKSTGLIPRGLTSMFTSTPVSPTLPPEPSTMLCKLFSISCTLSDNIVTASSMFVASILDQKVIHCVPVFIWALSEFVVISLTKSKM